MCLTNGFNFFLCVAVNKVVWGKKNETVSKKCRGSSGEYCAEGGFKNKNKNPPLWVPPCLKYRCQMVMLKNILIVKYYNVCVQSNK